MTPKVQEAKDAYASFRFVYDDDDRAVLADGGRKMPTSIYTMLDEHDVRCAHFDVRPGDVVLDVGAAYGSYALCALARGAARVIAWSPAQDAAPEMFRRSLAENGWSERCEVRTEALWSAPGWLEIPEYDAMPTFVPPAGDHRGKIECSTLDACIINPRVDRIDFLKLDVEGAEHEILKGARRTIERYHPKILLELHLFKRRELEAECDAFLTGLGYARGTSIPRCEGGIVHTAYTHPAGRQ